MAFHYLKYSTMSKSPYADILKELQQLPQLYEAQKRQQTPKKSPPQKVRVMAKSITAITAPKPQYVGILKSMQREQKINLRNQLEAIKYRIDREQGIDLVKSFQLKQEWNRVVANLNARGMLP